MSNERVTSFFHSLSHSFSHSWAPGRRCKDGRWPNALGRSAPVLPVRVLVPLCIIARIVLVATTAVAGLVQRLLGNGLIAPAAVRLRGVAPLAHAAMVCRLAACLALASSPWLVWLSLEGRVGVAAASPSRPTSGPAPEPPAPSARPACSHCAVRAGAPRPHRGHTNRTPAAPHRL